MRIYQRWPIYATKRMVEIIPYLCLKGEKHTVVANVLFHCLGSGQNDPDYNTIFRNDYMETLNHLYNNRSKFEDLGSPPKGVKEIVFSPFNMSILKEVSPTIYPSQKDHLISSLEESLQKFSMYYTNVKDNIDLNSLFLSVGSDFFRIIKLLRLEHKLEKLKSDTVNKFFQDLMARDDLDRVKALEFFSLLLSHKELDLFSPLVTGSLRPVDLLASISEAECRTSLEMFLRIISSEMQDQCLQFLRKTDPNTGLLVYPWAFREAELILSTKLEESPPGRFKGHKFVPNIEGSFVDRMIVNNVASLYLAFNTLKSLIGSKALNLIEPANSLKRFLSVHFEEDLVMLSTQKDTFILDLLIRDSLYRSSLYSLLNFLLSSNLVKVGHRFMLNVAKLSCQFPEPFRKYNQIVDLNDKRVKRTRSYKEDQVQESNVFRSTGLTRNLNGLLQEFNVPLPPKRRWKKDGRPIPIERIKYLCLVGRGILSIEHQLRSQGWMPSSICDTSFGDSFQNAVTISSQNLNPLGNQTQINHNKDLPSFAGLNGTPEVSFVKN